MTFSKIESSAYNIAKQVAESYGYEIYDIIYVKEGAHWFLRIFITSDGGVSLDDCERISRQISAMLDEKDFITANYFLEVSSPGIERVLRHDEHYEEAIGEEVQVRMYSAIENTKEIEGTLTKATQDSIKVNDISINKKNIAKANVLYDFAN